MKISRSSPSSRAQRPTSERGSLLIVAMIFCAIIGISLTSYILLSRTALKISNRGLYANASMNLAEDGLEQAMYSINKGTTDDTYSWSADGWTVSGLNAKRKWTGLNLSQNTTGEYRVYVYNYAGVSNPTIVTRSLVTLGGATSAPIEKWIRVTLSKTSKFSNGLVAKNSIVFNGNNTSVDSWNSDPDNNPATAAIKYSAGVRNDNGSVGSISVSTSAVLVKQADVWGYVATGSSDPTNSVGANGSILGSDSVPDSSWTKSTVDPNRVSTNFSANFDPVTAPATYTYTSVGALSANKTLPDDYPAATLQADGKYYIECTSIGGSNNVFTIAANKKVVLKVTDTSGNSVDIKGGSGALNINAGGSLEIYTAGDINIGGQGVMNAGTTALTAGQPVNLQIYGTKTSGTQNISIGGNGALSGCIYAPQGSVTVNGNGDVMGSIVANDITLVGNALFHYDESLSNLGGANPFRVAGWTELTTAADRATYSSVLTF